jgi:site-specific DNA-methyltransferase (adenine-specific)
LEPKKYGIIYADPPWSYQNAPVESKTFRGCAIQHYPTMTITDICALPIHELRAENCALFIWVTFPLLKEAFDVIEAWGFEYKTVAFTWVKLTEDGSPAWGCGFWTRSNAEICLLAIHGKPKRITKDVHQIIFSRRHEHSAKPHEIYSRIEKLMGNLPRIELFARTKREGWDAWGNEVPNETQMLLMENETATH